MTLFSRRRAAPSPVVADEVAPEEWPSWKTDARRLVEEVRPEIERRLDLARRGQSDGAPYVHIFEGDAGKALRIGGNAQYGILTFWVKCIPGLAAALEDAFGSDGCVIARTDDISVEPGDGSSYLVVIPISG